MIPLWRYRFSAAYIESEATLRRCRKADLSKESDTLGDPFL